jgi:hypothetical protein
MQIHPFFVGWI